MLNKEEISFAVAAIIRDTKRQQKQLKRERGYMSEADYVKITSEMEEYERKANKIVDKLIVASLN